MTRCTDPSCISSIGARALGLEGQGLREGSPATMVALDTSHPTLWAKQGDALLDGWIFGGGRTMIDTVWTNGRRQVEQGRHSRRVEIGRRYRQVMEALLRC